MQAHFRASFCRKTLGSASYQKTGVTYLQKSLPSMHVFDKYIQHVEDLANGVIEFLKSDNFGWTYKWQSRSAEYALIQKNHIDCGV